jgi:uncharacterized cupredoxin-like copper-binding protein
MKATIAVVAGVLASVLLLVSAVSAATPKKTLISVSMYEMGFKLSKKTVPRGVVVFKVRNDGKLAHDFSFGSRGGGTPMVDPGATATLTVTFKKAGTYTYICTVEGHQEGGMIGVLKVK